jgi:hypothetical protein
MSILRCSLILKIHHFINLKWKVVVKHFFREVNQCVNALRNIGCSMMTNINFYEVCPAQITHLISAVIKKIGYDSLINWNWNAGPNTIQILVLNICVFPTFVLQANKNKTESHRAKHHTDSRYLCAFPTPVLQANKNNKTEFHICWSYTWAHLREHIFPTHSSFVFVISYNNFQIQTQNIHFHKSFSNKPFPKKKNQSNPSSL